MDEAKGEKPIEEMSFHELRQEIGQRTMRFDFTVDPSSGRATVVALPVEERCPVVMRAGDRAEDVLWTGPARAPRLRVASRTAAAGAPVTGMNASERLEDASLVRTRRTDSRGWAATLGA